MENLALALPVNVMVFHLPNLSSQDVSLILPVHDPPTKVAVPPGWNLLVLAASTEDDVLSLDVVLYPFSMRSLSCLISYLHGTLHSAMAITSTA